MPDTNGHERIRFGIIMMPTDPWRESVDVARRVEALGYDHLWVFDHLTWRRYQDRDWHGIYPWLAAMAASTEQIRLGTMVASPNIRHPVVLAKDAMTIDHISGGRLILGVGAGGVGFDATAFGQEPLTPGQRVDRLDEYLTVLGGLLDGKLTDHRGKWYTVNDARMNPGCVQRPRLPVAVAAGHRRSIGLAAEQGDVWITNGITSLPDLTPERHMAIIAEQVDMFNQACVDRGRDPETIDRIVQLNNIEGRPLASIELFAEVVEQYQKLGFTDITFQYPRPEDPIWNDPPEMVDAIADRFLS
jgi:alkanesulfonate monooxygenase SsuD/methylene tetrahydromethanopterin reductase-like flavin-dependent oxidoreductase (luciferase family)